MSAARRTVEALNAAYEQLTIAHSAAVQYRNRSNPHDWRSHVLGLGELVTGTESITYLVRELAGVAKACADDARAHYSYGTDPDGQEWPDSVVEAAREVDLAMSRLRSSLEKVRVNDAHQAIGVLHASVQNVRRAARAKAN